mmetsp:Transcript_19877/g.50804  ORF Transcript_19877/g.50804 Transcript_19877/m.50804 type:complete len:85 (+) Transcript_19877:144-398(+)
MSCSVHTERGALEVALLEGHTVMLEASIQGWHVVQTSENKELNGGVFESVVSALFAVSKKAKEAHTSLLFEALSKLAEESDQTE